MSTIARDLIVGAGGSIIGAAVVYAVSSGIRINRGARLKNEHKRDAEIKLWRTRKIQVRMEITNYYLFMVLRDLLLGSIFTILPSVASVALDKLFLGRGISELLVLFTLCGLLNIFSGLGHALRYIEIRKSDEDYLNTYLADQMPNPALERTPTAGNAGSVGDAHTPQ